MSERIGNVHKLHIDHYLNDVITFITGQDVKKVSTLHDSLVEAIDVFVVHFAFKRFIFLSQLGPLC